MRFGTARLVIQLLSTVLPVRRLVAISSGTLKALLISTGGGKAGGPGVQMHDGPPSGKDPLLQVFCIADDMMK
jgi:hypothetical protein